MVVCKFSVRLLSEAHQSLIEFTPQSWPSRGLATRTLCTGAYRQAQAIPWYHYIPVRYDFLDLFDIVGYFSGAHDDPDTPVHAMTATTRTIDAESASAALPDSNVDVVATQAADPARVASRAEAEAEAEAARRPEEDQRVVQQRARAEELARRDKIAEDIGTRGRKFAVSRMGCVVAVFGSSQNCVLPGSSACCGQGVI